MTVYLIPNSSKPGALQLVEKAVDVLTGDGVRVLMEPAFVPLAGKKALVEGCKSEQAIQKCDIIVTIGGDGTMLHAARASMEHHKPLVGINMGQLGFLTIIESDELDKLHRISSHNYFIEQRTMLEATYSTQDRPYIALNDIVLFKQMPQSMITLNIYCDEVHVSSFRGDGVVFSTPTGSTAYSLSAGGPIVDAKLGGIVVTSICPHIIHAPPMVFDASRTMRVVSTSSNGQSVCMNLDGIDGPTLQSGDEIFIRQAKNCIPMIQFDDAGQLDSIDKKLRRR
ncbi:MAG: NAD(+)/NADH kinase [Oscillospiraceae bacterium]